MAVLAAYAMVNPIFRKTVSTKSIRVGDRYLRNHNKLLWRVEGADGVKTGYTQAAGRILVSSATRQGRGVVAVTLNAPDDWADHAMLIQDAFERYSQRRIVAAGESVGSVEVAGGEDLRVDILAREDFSYAIASDEIPYLVLPGPGFAYAPGADAGYAYVLIAGKAVGKVPVMYGKTVEQRPEEKRPFWKR